MTTICDERGRLIPITADAGQDVLLSRLGALHRELDQEFVRRSDLWAGARLETLAGLVRQAQALVTELNRASLEAEREAAVA